MYGLNKYAKGKEHTVLGIDGCRAGWICFKSNMDTRSTEWDIVTGLADLFRGSLHPRVVTVDVPIGLPSNGARICDLAARKLLGKPRSSSVFPPPVRTALIARTYEEACRLNFEACGKKLTQAAFGILPKIREVDGLITPELQSWIFEIHPEVCFWALNGGEPMKHKKSRKAGREERLKVLFPCYPTLELHLRNLDRTKAAPDDLLDAAAAAWTAERIAKGVAGSVAPPQSDSKDLRMEILY